MRLIIERLVPPRRSPCVSLDLGPTDDGKGVSEAQGHLLAAVADGVIAVDEALKVSQMLEARHAAMETADLVEEAEAVRAHCLIKEDTATQWRIGHELLVAWEVELYGGERDVARHGGWGGGRVEMN
jgi:hypothetical protein